jgi:transcriptional regulator with XRE-family HTH domain
MVEERGRIEDVSPPKRIRALLALRGETVHDLAERLQVSLTALSLRLTGQRAFSGRCGLQAVADALYVPLSTIRDGEPWPDVTNSE